MPAKRGQNRKDTENTMIDTSTKRRIKTRIFTYYFNVNDEKQSAAWSALVDERKAAGAKMHESWGGKSSHFSFIDEKGLNGKEIELETDHLFDDQWNTGPVNGSENGLRVFEFAMDAPINLPKHYKKGHYLEITEEMRAFKADWLKCGYCGHDKHKSAGLVFCPDCLDSVHLKPEDLHLLRLAPAGASFGVKRAELTEAEKSELLPKYVHAQTIAKGSRAKAHAEKVRADVLKKAEQEIENATTERNGMIWLLDHGLNIENVIYYNHTQRFGFGWRQAVSKEVENAILEQISEFPFLYEIKCADGRTLKNEE
jgi:hypothetical protein